MIPIKAEPEELSSLYNVLENCYFCERPTKYWNLKNNQPVCRKCSNLHKECELIPSHQDYSNLK